jgi:CRISPR-associated protein Cas5h
MTMTKILIFDISADTACFKQRYTIISQLTHTIIPGTAIYGILGGILGMNVWNSNEYLKHFQNINLKIGLKVINPIQQNLIISNGFDTNYSIYSYRHGENEKHTQVYTQYLINCKYRIYISCDDTSIYNKLLYNIKNNLCGNVCLGKAKCFAKIEFIGEYNLKVQTSDTWININSIIPIKFNNNNINIAIHPKTIHIKKESGISLKFNENRELGLIGDFIFNEEVPYITIKTTQEYYSILELNENIILF